MDSHILEKNCQLISHAIAGMIRRSLREEAFREKCFNLLQVTNSNDAELELQRKLRQCVLRHRQSGATFSNLQDANINEPEKSNADPVADSKTNDSHVVNKAAENFAVINSSFSGTQTVMQKPSVQCESNSQTEHHFTRDLIELESSLEWDSTLTQSCSPQKLFQQDSNIPQNNTNSTYDEKSNWFHPDSRELEW